VDAAYILNYLQAKPLKLLTKEFQALLLLYLRKFVRSRYATGSTQLPSRLLAPHLEGEMRDKYLCCEISAIIYHIIPEQRR
jgi:hypothetical protein